MNRMNTDQVVAKLNKLDQKFTNLCHWDWDGHSSQADISHTPSKSIRIARRIEDIQKRYQQELKNTKWEINPDYFPYWRYC